MLDEAEKVEKIEEEAGPETPLNEESAAAPLPSALGVAKRPCGSECSAGGTAEPQGDRTAVRRWPEGTDEVPTAAEERNDEEMEELRAELEKVRSQCAKLEHERFLLGRGVPEEDLDYYAFKIEQLEGAKENFAKAAKEYLKAHPLRRAAVSSGAELGAGGSRRPASSSELMNQLLRDQG